MYRYAHSFIWIASYGAVLLAQAAVAAENGTLVATSPVELDDAALRARLDESQLAELGPKLRAVREAVDLQAITYLSDGLKVKGYLATPKQGERLPCVIVNRGGNREFGALDDVRAALWLGRVASQGYVVVGSQYRGTAGGEGRDEFGGADVNDVLSLIPLLDSLPRADGTRIGMYGWSRGGLMTYLALRRTDRIRAAVIGAAVADAAAMVERRPEMEEHVLAEVVPDWEQQREAALSARSPLRWVESLPERTPLLLLHGSADWRVDPTDSLRMATALLEQRRPFRLVMFEGGDHGLTEHRAEVDRLVDLWLRDYVRDGKAWPSLEPHGR